MSKEQRTVHRTGDSPEPWVLGFRGLKGGVGPRLRVPQAPSLALVGGWGQGLTVGAAPWEVMGSGPSSWDPCTEQAAPHSLVGMLFFAFGQSETDFARRPEFGCPGDDVHLRLKASQKPILCPVRLCQASG